MKNKNKLLMISSLVALTSIVSGCKNGGEEPKPVEEEEIPYTLDEYKFKKVYENSGEFRFGLYNDSMPKAASKVVYKINKSIGTDNYLKIELETDCNLVGWINYSDENNPSKTNSEKFFIEKGSTEFKTFLDAFRDSCYGGFKKKIINEVIFSSVESEYYGKMTFKSLSCSDRVINTERMYIDDGTIKLGTSVKFGGSVEWLERIDIYVCEYLDNGLNVRIDRDIDPATIQKDRFISSEVNMVNIYDYGREIQPSYYLKVDKEHNGYDPKTKYNYESLDGHAKYNPIQCGGVGDHATGVLVGAQVIDYEYKPDHIYIKSKGQDWMFENDQAEGYIEVNYHFGEDGVLVVDNSYTDFYGFSGLNSVDNPMSGQETPATYFSYPLNYFYMKTKNKTIYDPYVGPQNGLGTCVEDPAASGGAAGSYFYGLKGNYSKNNCDWFAFTNDQKFGAGIYMPNCDYFIASRGNVSTNYNEKYNRSYNNLLYNFGSDYTPSYAASNYNYLNPQIRRRMIEYVPLQYQYCLFIGDVEEMDEAFANAKASGIDNEILTRNEGTWPRV